MAATDEVATFSLYDFGGRLSGFQQYRPLGEKKANNKNTGKYWSYVPSGGVGIFGFESWDFSDVVYLTGGLFKAATLHRLGYTALHVSAVSYKYLRPQLQLTGRPFRGIGDADDEGAQFARRYNGWQSPADVDEMSDEDVHRMLDAFKLQ
jgi:hypothetical protein